MHTYQNIPIAVTEIERHISLKLKKKNRIKVTKRSLSTSSLNISEPFATSHFRL